MYVLQLLVCNILDHNPQKINRLLVCYTQCVMDDHTIKQLTDIGIALSQAEDREALLKLILDVAVDLTGAEGGTLYLLKEDLLEFHLMRNDVLGRRVEDVPSDLKGVPLYAENGTPNADAVIAMALCERHAIHVEDVATETRYDLHAVSEFDQAFDYKTTSLLAVPMLNHEADIIGGFQLVNASTVRGEHVPFSNHAIHIAESLASQAAIILTQKMLLDSYKDLFDSFIRLIAVAIDEKSPYTSRHCQRVPVITLIIAEAINQQSSGIFADIYFNADQLNELKVAAWMHDCGKLTTPEYVVDKATKLETIFDRIHLLEVRYHALCLDAKIRYLEIDNPTQADRTAYQHTMKTLAEELDFLKRMNQGGEFLSHDDHQRLNQIAKQYHWTDCDGRQHAWLTEDELTNLSIERGTLNAGERQIINNHAAVSLRMLQELPFPKDMKNVPDIAGNHHEAVNGQGYPRGLSGDALSVQARILAIADVFEALTAADRPYKKAKPIDEVRTIMTKMVESGHLDPGIVTLFFDQKLYRNI